MEQQNLIAYIKVFIVSAWSWMMSYFHPLIGVAAVFFACFAIDFFTGLFASFAKGKKFRSYRARESIFKFLVYIGSFALLLSFGVEVAKMNQSDEIGEMMVVLKVIIYVAAWFETKSIMENLKILFPNNQFIAFLDYMLGVEFVKKITWLKNFLDQENKDNLAEEN